MKAISGYPNYSITKDGRVWSRPRKNTKGGWLRSGKDKCGYLFVNLCEQKACSKSVHRLVLETYVGPCPKGGEGRHLDGDPTNNHLDNLKWGTRSENQVDSVNHGTAANLRLTFADVRMIVYMYRTGLFRQQELAETYHVAQQTIDDILHKRTWKHIWTTTGGN